MSEQKRHGFADFADFDRFCEEHPELDPPEAFAQWMANSTGEAVIGGPVEEPPTVVALPECPSCGSDDPEICTGGDDQAPHRHVISKVYPKAFYNCCPDPFHLTPHHPKGEDKMSEVRLMAMRFVPSNEGGYWTPAAADSDTRWVQDRAWADAWENGITEEEAEDLYRIAAVYRKVEAPSGDALRKLRSAFQPDPVSSS